MNEKLDLVQILKDCLKGMELDCVAFNGVVTFDEIVNDSQYPIRIKIDDKYSEYLDKYGCFYDRSYCKCIIFPKGKTTWEGFQRPFVDGDIVFYNDTIAIFKEWGDETLFRTYVTKYLCCDSLIDMNTPLFGKGIRKKIRFATEKEKEQLFQAIKDHGYKWNSETKTLEKLIEPKFKVGDKIIHKSTGTYCTLGEYAEGISAYHTNIGLSLTPKDLEQWELMSNKFDPKTLRPFYKVLVTDSLSKTWYAGFLSYIDEENKTYPFVVGFGHHRYCIPYNDDTKHLAGKSGEVPKFYRYWEE